MILRKKKFEYGKIKKNRPTEREKGIVKNYNIKKEKDYSLYGTSGGTRVTKKDINKLTNKKPNTKPFDFIEEVFKTPYKIRGGDLPKNKKGGLTKWFNEKWVDISAPKRGGGYKECGRKSASGSNRKYPKCVPAAKASRMTESEKRSAVARKRAAGNPGGKPTNVKTFTKRYYGGMIDI